MHSDSPPSRIGRVKEHWWRVMSLHGSSPAGVRAVIARVLSGRLPFLLFFLLFFLPFALAWSPVVRALRVSWPAEQQHLHTVLFACAVVRQILESGIQDGPFLWSLRACVLLLVLFALVALRPTPRVRTPHLIGYALILLFMVECYLPSFVMVMLNPDEAQYLSQAITLRHDINYFARIDSGTNGPVITGSLFLPNLLSGFLFSFDYAYARLIGAICLALVPIMLIAGARRIPDNRYAWLGVLPIAFTLGLMSFAASLDIVAYNAHHVPMVLCTAGSSLALMAHFGSARAARVLFFLSGSCLALVLFTKLQWAPVAATCGLMAMLSCVVFSASMREGLLRATTIAAGGVVIIVLFLGLLSISGQFTDFAARYVIGQLNYATHHAALTLAQRVSLALALHDYANEAMRGALPWLLAASLALWIASAALALGQRARIRVWKLPHPFDRAPAGLIDLRRGRAGEQVPSLCADPGFRVACDLLRVVDVFSAVRRARRPPSGSLSFRHIGSRLAGARRAEFALRSRRSLPPPPRQGVPGGPCRRGPHRNPGAQRGRRTDCGLGLGA